MTAKRDVRKQRVCPNIVRGEHFAWPLVPNAGATVPATFPTTFRFAIGLVGEDPLVTVTQAVSANGRVTNPSSTTILVTLTTAATRLLTGDREHMYTLYVTVDGFEYVWAMGPVMVEFGAGELP